MLRGIQRESCVMTNSSPAPTLSRPRTGRVIGGVCAGIAQRFGWSPNAVRLAFLISCLLPGPQVIIYIAAWIIVPSA